MQLVGRRVYRQLSVSLNVGDDLSMDLSAGHDVMNVKASSIRFIAVRKNSRSHRGGDSQFLYLTFLSEYIFE